MPGICDELFSVYRVYILRSFVPSFLPSVLISVDLFFVSFFLVGASCCVALPWLDNLVVRWLRLTRRGKRDAGGAWYFVLVQGDVVNS